jgi:hypothetical protein
LENLIFNEESHLYTYDGKRIPSVSNILLDEGFINAQWFTEEGRRRGTDVHATIKNHCLGAHCMLKESVVPYFSAFKNFQNDCDWKAEIIEEPMACDQYAGTADQFGTLNGHLSVLDIKSGVISRATGLQLSAYEKLYWIYKSKVNGTIKSNLNPLMKRFALQLTDTGRYILTEFKDRIDRFIWDSAVAIWWFKKNMRNGKQ